MLRVFDARAQVALLPQITQFFQYIQNLAHRRVADGVADGYKPRLNSFGKALAQNLGSVYDNAGCAAALIGLEHPGRQATERPIHKELCPADLKVFAALPRRQSQVSCLFN